MTTLYLQIRDEVADQIIKHGLSKTESKLFFYLLKLDRFGNKPTKVKVAEILLATGIGKTAYHAAIAKFQMMGWFDFKHDSVEISNQCAPIRESDSSEKRTDSSESRTGNSEKRTGIPNSDSAKTNQPILKPAPSKASEPRSNIYDLDLDQNYTDFLRSISEEEAKKFERFCERQIKSLSFKVNHQIKWLDKHYSEYWREFKAEKPYEAPVKPQSLAQIKLMYKSSWKSAAAHYGFTEAEIKEFENLEGAS